MTDPRLLVACLLFGKSPPPPSTELNVSLDCNYQCRYRWYSGLPVLLTLSPGWSPGDRQVQYRHWSQATDSGPRAAVALSQHESDRTAVIAGIVWGWCRSGGVNPGPHQDAVRPTGLAWLQMPLPCAISGNFGHLEWRETVDNGLCRRQRQSGGWPKTAGNPRGMARTIPRAESADKWWPSAKDKIVPHSRKHELSEMGRYSLTHSRLSDWLGLELSLGTFLFKLS